MKIRTSRLLLGALLACLLPAPWAAAHQADVVIHLDDEGRPVVPDSSWLAPAESLPSEVGDEGLSDEPQPELQPAPGGGEMLILDDRFRHQSIADVETAPSGGAVAVHCGYGGEPQRDAPAPLEPPADTGHPRP